MVDDTGDTSQSVYRERYPQKNNTREAAVLLVTQQPETARAVGELLINDGYAFKATQQLDNAATDANNSYLEAIVLDIAGITPKAEPEANSTARPSNDALSFLMQVQATNPKLEVLLINSQSNVAYQQPALRDLGRQNNVPKPEPIEVSTIETDPANFLETLRTSVQAARDGWEASRTLASRHLAERLRNADQPFTGLPLAVGLAVKGLYEHDRAGGGAFFDRESIGGAAASVSPRREYPEGVVGFHIKRGEPGDEARTQETYALLTRVNPERRGRIPRPLGASRDQNAVHLVQTFIIGSTFVDLREALLGPDVPEAERKIMRDLWTANLDLFFRVEFPKWYRDTHDEVMKEESGQARNATIRQQINQIMLLPNRTSLISGRPLPPEVFNAMLESVPALYDSMLGPIDPRLFVLPMDPKGANIGLLTYQSIPTRENLLRRFTTQTALGRQVDTGKLAAAFVHWDYKTLGKATPFLVDLWQNLLDPRLQIPEEERPVRLAEALEGILKYMPDGTRPEEFVVETWRQGVYKAAFKAYVCASHAQQNEGRLLTMRSLDEEATANNTAMHQNDVDYFLRQTMRMLSGLYVAIQEGHASLGWDKAMTAMADHLKDQRRVELPEKGMGAQPNHTLDSIRKLHEGFALIQREGLAQLNPGLLRKNYGTKDALTY